MSSVLDLFLSSCAHAEGLNLSCHTEPQNNLNLGHRRRGQFQATPTLFNGGPF